MQLASFPSDNFC